MQLAGRRLSSFTVADVRRLAGVAVSLTGFRWLAAACEAATILITWPLWQVHRAPPMLPALPLPQVDLGIALLVTLGVLLVRPLLGVALHSVVLLYAMLIDQTRIQPEVVSLTLLLWATLPSAAAQALGRFHLVALWCWAGINKLLSPAFLDGTAQWMLQGLIPDAPRWLESSFGYVVVAGELGTGILAAVPRTRRVAAVSALAVHTGILLVLSPYVGHHWNEAIWPWNVALALAGFALIAPWRESLTGTLRRAPLLLRPLLLLLLVAPAGFYVGLTDAYLAHNLYSSNVPTTLWCDAANRCRQSVETTATFETFNVPVPPEHRLLKAYFEKTCSPGDRLVVSDTRRWVQVRDSRQRTFTCPRR